jgi:hypothetical protein
LVRNLSGQRFIEAAMDVNLRQLLTLEVRVYGEFTLFAGDVGTLGIGLGADRHVFACRHRQGTSNQSGKSGQKDRSPVGRGGSDADQETGGRDDTVIGTEDSGAKPANPFDSMPLLMVLRRLTRSSRIGRQSSYQIAGAWRPLQTGDHGHDQVFAVAKAVTVDASLVGRLQRAFPEVIAGVKDSAGDWNHTLSLLNEHRDLAILVGHEGHLAEAVRHGASGSISGIANVAPRLLQRLVQGIHDPVIDDALKIVLSMPVVPALRAILTAQTGDRAWLRPRAPLDEIVDPEELTRCEALSRRLT